MEDVLTYLAEHPAQTVALGGGISAGISLTAHSLYLDFKEAKETRQMLEGFAEGYDLVVNNELIKYDNDVYAKDLSGLENLKKDLREDGTNSFEDGVLKGAYEAVRD